MQDWKEIFFKLFKNLAVNFSPVATECTLAFHVLKCLNTARGERLLVEFDSARIVSWFVCTTCK